MFWYPILLNIFLVLTKKYETIFKKLIEEKLIGENARACFLTILHLLKISEIDINYSLLSYTIDYVNLDKDIKNLDIPCGVLSQILFLKGSEFKKHKEKVNLMFENFYKIKSFR